MNMAISYEYFFNIITRLNDSVCSVHNEPFISGYNVRF